jgi:hypothetical protein
MSNSVVPAGGAAHAKQLVRSENFVNGLQQAAKIDGAYFADKHLEYRDVTHLSEMTWE